MTSDQDSGNLLAHALGTIPLPPGDLGLEQARAAFRRSRTGSCGRRRWARRVSLTLVASIAMSGGVAAAYAASLPAPMQRVAHRVFSALGVPAPHREHRRDTRYRDHYVQVPRRRDVTPSALPVVLRADRFTAPVGDEVTVSASAPGTRAGTEMVLLIKVGTTWRDYARAATSADGTAVFRVRLNADTVFAAETAARPADRSRPIALVAVPRLDVVVDRAAAGWRIDVRATGAVPGERVLLVVDSPAIGRRVVTSGRIGRHHWARLDLPHPSSRVRYVVVIPATSRHGQATAVVTARDARP